MKENKEEVCPNCDIHSHCSLHDPELFEDMMDTPQTIESPSVPMARFADNISPPQTSKWEEIAKEIVGKWGYEEEYWWKPIAEALSQAEERGRIEERERIFKQLNTALNKHSKPITEGGLDYIKAFKEVEKIETDLLNLIK